MLYILTLTWNKLTDLIKLQNTLLPNLEGLTYKWIIKDNASTDGTYEEIKNWTNTHAIKYPNNHQNFSQGVNLCFNEANPKDDDYILLLNNDVIFNDNTSIKNMIEQMKPDVGVVGARLLYTNTNKLQHAGVTFEPLLRGPQHFRSKEISDENAEKNRYFQVVTGAVLLTKSGLFRNAYKNKDGKYGCDENYHWAFDDVDLCLSIRYNLDKKIVYCGQTNIFHEESSSLKKNPVNKMFLSHNLMYLNTKWKNRYKIDKQLYKDDPNYMLVK